MLRAQKRKRKKETVPGEPSHWQFMERAAHWLSSPWMLSSQSWHVNGTVLPFNIQGSCWVHDDTRCTGCKRLKKAHICLSSWLTAEHNGSSEGGRSPLHLPALFIFSCSRGGGVGQLKWCILVNICWPRISCWQTCRQADTEASLLGCQGCDTADTSPHGSWLPQLLLGKLVSHWRGSLRTLCQMPSMLLPRPLPNGGLKMFPVPAAHTSDHRARLFPSLPY